MGLPVNDSEHEGTAIVAALRAELVRLERVNRALMARVERDPESQCADDHLLRTAVTAEEEVRDRTAALEDALRENERVTRALAASEAKFAALFRLTPEPLILTRLHDGLILEVNRRFTEVFAYEPSELVGRESGRGGVGLWVDDAERRAWRDRLEREGEVLGLETQLVRRGGTAITVLLSGRVVELDAVRCVIAEAQDITEQKAQAQRLEQLAHHDPLTGLPNRVLLWDRLRQAMARNERGGTHLAVCYLDLDGFKAVNDELGHQAGDEMLIEVSRRLLSSVRGGDTVARLGGDEFVVLLSDLTDDEQCRHALDRLLDVVGAPYLFRGRELSRVTASVGVTLFPGDAVDADTLVRHADHAMYTAKLAGKRRYQLFDDRLEQRLDLHHSILDSIERSLTSGELELHYQPKVDCRAGRLVGVEALLRWRHPTLGLLTPAAFVPLFQDTELAVEVGAWALREALAQASRWRAEGLTCRVSVNTFERQLIQTDFVELLLGLLEAYPEAGPDALMLELVETSALKGLETIRRVVDVCARHGVTFSLDDFGTGSSTLAHLRHLPVEEIKIDQSFVSQMLERREDHVLIEAIIGLGRAFGRIVVAEGVETPRQVAHLLELGCDVMQGFALARPMPAAEFSSWARAFRPDPAWSVRPGDGGGR